jgi:hypothetical protein
MISLQKPMLRSKEGKFGEICVQKQSLSPLDWMKVIQAQEKINKRMKIGT